MTGAAPLPPGGRRIGSRLRLVPPLPAPSPEDVVDVIVTPGAFGSGEHETTASCLEALCDLDVAGVRVLDVGSGTGVLGIASVLLGAALAVCLDPEPGAVVTARRNGRLNGIGERLLHVRGTLDALCRDAEFSLVLANLYGDLLLREATRIAAAVAPGGRVLLSGMAWEHAFDVRERFRRLGLVPVRSRMLDEFVTMLLTRE